MDLKNFDKQIKSSLENLEAPFDPASWLSLENRMNAVFSEEQPAPVEPVDLVVKRTLDRFEVPYQAADWQLLSNKLNQLALARRIRMSKLSEAAIFLLLLVNIEGFLGGFKEVLKPAAPQPIKSNVPMAANHHGKNGKHHSNTQSTDKDASVITQLAEQVVAIIAAPFNNGADNMSDVTVPASQLTSNASNSDASVLDGGNFYQHSGMVNFQKMTRLPQTKLPDFAWKNFFETIPGVITPAPRKANGLYAASFASFEQNNTHVAESIQHQNGFGGGLAVGYRKGKWGVETGIAYSRKVFNPEKDVEIYAGSPAVGFIGAYVNNVDADVFSVPVKGMRRLAKMGKATAYAVAGVTANVATEKRYGYKTVVYPPLSPDPTPGGPNPNQVPLPKKDHQGWLEGGSFRKNVYATADMGVRVEHPLGRHYVAFIEPAYRHALGKGFGPKGERINSFSLQAGVMAAL